MHLMSLVSPGRKAMILSLLTDYFIFDNYPLPILTAGDFYDLFSDIIKIIKIQPAPFVVPGFLYFLADFICHFIPENDVAICKLFKLFKFFF